MSYTTVKWDKYWEHYHLLSGNLLVFEIGVAGGGSLYRLKEINPDATVVGIDVDERCQAAASPKDGIHVEIGSVMSSKFLMGLLLKYGSPDMVIDDGGHRPWHHIAAFRVLFPHLKFRGTYCIEDIHVCRSWRWSLIPGGAMWYLIPYLFNRWRFEVVDNLLIAHRDPITPYLIKYGDSDCRLKEVEG